MSELNPEKSCLEWLHFVISIFNRSTSNVNLNAIQQDPCQTIHE
jgi:hypothetical protein